MVDHPNTDQARTERPGARSARRAGGWALLVAGVPAVVVASVAVAWVVGVQSGTVPFPTVLGFGLPVVACAVVFWVQGKHPGEFFSLVGFRRGDAGSYARSLLVVALLLGLFVVLRALVAPGFTPVSSFAGLELALPALAATVFLTSAFTVTLGEEVLFRGLVDGWTMRRFGYYPGNALGTAAFTAVHVPILFTAGLDLWPLLLVAVVGGWALGWLRHRSGSIWPGWLAHTLANTISLLVFA